MTIVTRSGGQRPSRPLQARNPPRLESPEMAAPEDIQAASDEVDIAALYARLRQEIRRTGAVERNGNERSSARAAVRGFAERYWAVTAERKLERRPGLKGALALPVKKLLRPFLRWYVEPLAYDQRMFNDAALKLIDALHEELDRVDSALAALRATDTELGDRLQRVGDELGHKLDESRWELSERLDHETVAQAAARQLLGEVEERLTRAERRPTRDAPRTVAPQPKADAFPDYFAFESKLRGHTESVKERQRVYVDDFRDAAPVLDVGCGRGELLALLREAGVEARGIDADADMVAFARGEGLEVEQADGVAYLEGLADGSLGGVFAAQVVEHLPPPALLSLLELA